MSAGVMACVPARNRSRGASEANGERNAAAR